MRALTARLADGDDLATALRLIAAPAVFTQPCPWAKGSTVAEWLLPRVLELTYTSWDLAPFARDCGYTGAPFGWDEERRFQLRCELDALFFRLYGIARDDAEYIMGTFPIVERNDMKEFGTFRTRDEILRVYDGLEGEGF